MGGRRADQLLRLPVRVDGIEVGRPVDVVLDPAAGRALGLEVFCRDEAHRFLPLAAAEFEADQIKLATPFALVDHASSEFYRGRATTLRALRGALVRWAGLDVGTLEDVVVAADGEIETFVVVAADGRAEQVPAASGVVVDGNGR